MKYALASAIAGTCLVVAAIGLAGSRSLGVWGERAGQRYDSVLTQDTGRLTVSVENRSGPALCAENDNVTISVSGVNVRSFQIDTTHPVYVGMTSRDLAPREFWTACDWGSQKLYTPRHAPGHFVLYEDSRVRLVGHTQETWWRPDTVSVRVGTHVTASLHVLQLWVIRPGHTEQVLVLYPQDGYFRARPLAPPPLKDTAYGSSFLVGPVEYVGKRPLVQFTEVEFDPATLTFHLTFRQGGRASVRLTEVNDEHQSLRVIFTPVVVGRPFAMLRSMYVTEFNNDVSQIAVRDAGTSWREYNILDFKKGLATDIWMGRLVPSRHNTLSPDVVFDDFSSTEVPQQMMSSNPR